MKRHPVGVEEENGLRYVLGRGKCSRCRVRCWKRSWDGLCMACLVAERDGYKTDSECGSELLHEAYCALSGVAGELLRPCVRPCGGHLRPDASALYRLGLERYGRLYAAAHHPLADRRGTISS